MSSETDRSPGSSGSFWSQFEPRDVAPFVTLALLVAFFSFASRDFFSPGTITLVLQRGAVLGIVSVELTFAAGKGGDKAMPSAAIVMLVTVAPLLVAVVLGFVSGFLTVASRMPS